MSSSSTRNNRTPLVIGGVIVFLCLCAALIAAVAGAYFVLNPSSSTGVTAGVTPAPNVAPPALGLSNPPTFPTITGGGACDDVKEYDDQGYDHIRPGEPHPAYNSNPPTSGWHWAQAQEWGVYDRLQVQEQLVHNLEHGGIVIQYNNLSPAELQRIIEFVRRNPRHLLVAPYPGLPRGVRVAVTAWTYLLECDGVNLEALAEFVDEFRDQGPEFIP